MKCLKDQLNSPLRLPRCDYPKACDIEYHGILTLPAELSFVDFQAAEKYRSDRYHPVGIKAFEKSQILEMASVIAQSFAVNDPMNRHIHPTKKMPESIVNEVHHDSFGKDKFGPWTSENVFYWFIRLFILTNSSDSIDEIKINEDMLRLSLAICDAKNRIIGGAFNLTVSGNEKPFRDLDPFIDSLNYYLGPILEMVRSQEHDAMTALIQKYPSFKKAH